MHHPIPTTGRLSSRMSEADIAKLLARLQPHLPTAADWAHPEIELEIGMGNGLALLARAQAAPHRLFVGSELYLNGLQVALNHLTPAPRSLGEGGNIRLTNHDARALLATIPPATLSRILIPFPDPWPKSGHHKRRIVQPSLLDEAARTLKPGGELWVVTDWPSYAYHTIATLFPHPAFTLAQTGGQAADCKPSARLDEKLGPHHLATPPAWWVPTKYQAKAYTAGRVPWFIEATRK
ncbi:MAG: hypothetical protein WAZ18_00710 [Alphaproteobacteria bacterium]